MKEWSLANAKNKNVTETFSTTTMSIKSRQSDRIGVSNKKETKQQIKLLNSQFANNEAKLSK